MIIYPPKSPVAFDLFNIHIHFYGIIMAFAIFTGIFLSCILFKKFRSNAEYDLFLDISPVVVIFSIIGARLFYVIGNFEFYFENPKEIFMINHGGISIYGAILFGFITFFVLSKIKKFELFSFCDVIACIMPLCQSIGRWGNYFNQEAYGRAYDGFLKLFVDSSYRPQGLKDVEYYHPAFLYESVLDFLLFIILILVFTKGKNQKTGVITALYLILYSIIRIIVESIRIDSVCYIFSMPVATIIALLTIIASFVFIFTRFIKR